MGDARNSLLRHFIIGLFLLAVLGAAVTFSVRKDPGRMRRNDPDRPKLFLREFQRNAAGESRALLSLDLLRLQPAGDCCIRRALYLATWPADQPTAPRIDFIGEVSPGLPYVPHSLFQGSLMTVDGETAVAYSAPLGENTPRGGPITSWIRHGKRYEVSGVLPGTMWGLRSRNGRWAQVWSEGKTAILKLPYFEDRRDWRGRIREDDYFDDKDPLLWFFTNDGRWVITGTGLGAKNVGKVVLAEVPTGTTTVIQLECPERHRPILVDAEVVADRLTILVGYQHETAFGIKAYALHDATGKKISDLQVKLDLESAHDAGTQPWDPENDRFVKADLDPYETGLNVEVLDYQGKTTREKLGLPKLTFASAAQAPGSE